MKLIVSIIALSLLGAAPTLDDMSWASEQAATVASPSSAVPQRSNQPITYEWAGLTDSRFCSQVNCAGTSGFSEFERLIEAGYSSASLRIDWYAPVDLIVHLSGNETPETSYEATGSFELEWDLSGGPGEILVQVVDPRFSSSTLGTAVQPQPFIATLTLS